MSILVNHDTRIILSGISTPEGIKYAQRIRDSGTPIVAGIEPGKGGTNVSAIPVYNNMRQSLLHHQANTAVIFSPARNASFSIVEALEAKIPLIICCTSGIPAVQMLKTIHLANKTESRLIGSGSAGILSPEGGNAGMLLPQNHKRGSIGMLSRQAPSLLYEAAHLLSKNGFGQSTCISLGDSPVAATNFSDLLPLFELDPKTEAVILLGEGSPLEMKKAAETSRTMTKPVLFFSPARSMLEPNAALSTSKVSKGSRDHSDLVPRKIFLNQISDWLTPDLNIIPSLGEIPQKLTTILKSYRQKEA